MKSEDLTGLLRAWSRGDREAEERLLPLVYAELRRQAGRQMRRERKPHTLRPTALVHEAYLRLVRQRETWQNRVQFFAVAAKMMRRVLLDHARRHDAVKRDGAWRRVTLDESVATTGPRDLDVLALEDALRELAELDPARARLVELRFFGGLGLEETAEVLQVSESTVTREWRLARAWLYRRLGSG